MRESYNPSWRVGPHGQVFRRTPDLRDHLTPRRSQVRIPGAVGRAPLPVPPVRSRRSAG